MIKNPFYYYYCTSCNNYIVPLEKLQGKDMLLLLVYFEFCEFENQW